MLPWGNYVPGFALPDLEQGLKSAKKALLVSLTALVLLTMLLFSQTKATAYWLRPWIGWVDTFEPGIHLRLLSLSLCIIFLSTLSQNFLVISVYFLNILHWFRISVKPLKFWVNQNFSYLVHSCWLHAHFYPQILSTLKDVLKSIWRNTLFKEELLLWRTGYQTLWTSSMLTLEFLPFPFSIPLGK